MSRYVGTAAEFYGILGVKSVIVQTNSGLALYEKEFSNIGVESSLISGFSSALSSMFESLSTSDKKGFQTFQARQMSITMHKLEISKMIIISDDQLPRMLLKQIEKSHEDIEETFSEELKPGKLKYDLLPYDGVEEIFEKHNLKLLLVEKIFLDKEKIREMRATEEKGSRIGGFIELLDEFEREVIGEPCFRINRLVDFLNGKSVNRMMISNIISTLYAKYVFLRCQDEEEMYN